jgi:hypothetical protein
MGAPERPRDSSRGAGMGLVDELLTPVHCRMQGASPIYETILRLVLTKYKNKPQQTQAIIFAVTYLMYSRKKKLSVNSMMQGPGRITKIDQNTLNTMAATAETNIDSDCTNAFGLFQELSEATLENALSRVNTSISASLLPITNDIAACRAAISGVQTSLAPIPFWSRKTALKVFSFLFLDSFKHLIILLMAIFVWALGILYIIDNYVPPVRKAIGEFIAEERLRYFPQRSPSLLRRAPTKSVQPPVPGEEPSK